MNPEALPGGCSLCGRLVLGLDGYDWCVLPWMLDPAVIDDEVLLGPCHVRCLHELGVARVWAAAVQGYYCDRWPLWRAGVTGGVRWQLHAAPRARGLHLWRSDARLSSFASAVLGAGRARLTTELGEVGSAHAGVLLAAMGTDENGVGVPLAEVIAALGLTDRYPAVGGLLARRLKNVGSDRRPQLIDLLVADYPLTVGPAVREAARELAADTPQWRKAI